MPMTTEKLRDAFLACEAVIARKANELGVTTAIRDGKADTPAHRVSHTLWLAREGLQLVEDERREKAMRWLGFLQGALWSDNLLTIDDLKDMNRPDDSERDDERV